MPAEIEDVVAVRHEIWDLLQQQMETLRSSQELTDMQLIECYNRQLRVQNLRDKIESFMSWSMDAHPITDELPLQARVTPGFEDVLHSAGTAT